MLTGLGAGVVAALVWAQFRGYDMLDGATYYLLYQNPADNPDLHTRFHLLARPFWLLCGQNIVVFRLLTLALATGAVWHFWRAWRHLLPDAPGPLTWWPLWLATLAGICWVPVALTYNSFATLFCLVGLTALLGPLGFAGSAFAAHGRNMMTGAGLFLTSLYGLFLVKPPAAAALAVAGYGLLCFDSRLPHGMRRTVRWTALGVVFAAISTAIIAVTRSGFEVDKLSYLAGVTFSPAWILATLQRYTDEMARMWPALRGDFVWTLVPTLLACVAALIPSSSKSRRWRSASLAMLLGACAAAFFIRRLWDGSFTAAVSGEAARFYLLLWGSFAPVWLVISWRGQPSEEAPQTATSQPGLWVLILLLLPLAGSVGTTNTLYVAALHQTVFWSAGLLLVFHRIARAFAAAWFRPTAALLLCLGAAGHLFSGHFWRPYMFQPSLWRQTEAAQVGVPATALKLDPALARFLREVRSTLDAHGYQPGQDVFGFFNLPGVIYAMGAKQPGAPWYFGTWYDDDDTDGGKLRQVPLERRHRAWIITQADVTRFRREFHESGIDFPDGYEKIGQTINPATGLEIGIWKPKAKP